MNPRCLVCDAELELELEGGVYVCPKCEQVMRYPAEFIASIENEEHERD